VSLVRIGTSYGGVLRAAKSAGYTASSSSALRDTIAVMAIYIGVWAYGFATTYTGGELRQPNKNAVRAILAAMGLIGVVTLAMSALALRTFGRQFLGAATYLQYVDPKHYPFQSTSYVTTYTELLPKNSVVILLVGGGLALSVLLSVFPLFLETTRSLFAWAFDRILPVRLADVNERTHSPIVANVVILVLMLGAVAAYLYGPATFAQFVLTTALGQTLTFIVVAVSAIAFPLRRRELFAQSALTRRWAGIPVITILGLIALAVYLLEFIPLLTIGGLGANTKPGLIATAAIAISGFAIYWLSLLVNRKRGVDLRLTFHELPPE
jgi:APA family basic amino acid/polyamine antiporter